MGDMTIVTAKERPCDGAIEQPTGEWLVPEGADLAAKADAKPAALAKGYRVTQVPAGVVALEVGDAGRVVPVASAVEAPKPGDEKPAEDVGEVVR